MNLKKAYYRNILRRAWPRIIEDLDYPFHIELSKAAPYYDDIFNLIICFDDKLAFDNVSSRWAKPIKELFNKYLGDKIIVKYQYCPEKFREVKYGKRRKMQYVDQNLGATFTWIPPQSYQTEDQFTARPDLTIICCEDVHRMIIGSGYDYLAYSTIVSGDYPHELLEPKENLIANFSVKKTVIIAYKDSSYMSYYQRKAIELVFNCPRIFIQSFEPRSFRLELDRKVGEVLFG